MVALVAFVALAAELAIFCRTGVSFTFEPDDELDVLVVLDELDVPVVLDELDVLDDLDELDVLDDLDVLDVLDDLDEPDELSLAEAAELVIPLNSFIEPLLLELDDDELVELLVDNG